MKKLYFLLLAFILFTTAKAQIIDIPDANFKAKLLASTKYNGVAKNYMFQDIKIDINDDNQIQLEEALNVCYIDVSNQNINSLVGIGSFINLLEVKCSSNKLSSLDLSELTNLKNLWCDFNQLTNLNLNGLHNLDYLVCSYNQLINLDLNDLNNLYSLQCDNNKLGALVLSNLTNLQYFNCGFNQLLTLNLDGLTNLISLTCHMNQLSTLKIDSLPKLINVDCGGNFLNSLELTNLTNLVVLDCQHNQLKFIDLNGTLNLKELYCEYNLLSNLNVNSLIYLERFTCSYNELINLQVTDLKKLSSIGCSNNNLSELQLSGLTNLQSLSCSFNQLTSLDLNNFIKITDLYCANNQLKNLDVSNLPLLYILDCGENKISLLNVKNGPTIISPLRFVNNPELKFICIDETEISNVLKQLNIFQYTNCVINTYCSFTPGGTFYSIQGNQKLDSNDNGCDINDILLPNLKCIITNGSVTGSLISNLSGNYSIAVQAGTYTITPKLENPNYFTISTTSFNVTFPTQTSPFTQDFCITPNGVHPDLEISLIPLARARPGFDAKYKIVYKSKGNIDQSGSVNLTFNDAVLDLVEANPFATNQTTNNFSWNFTDLKPFETREITFTMNVNSHVETPAVNIGDILNFTTTVKSPATDETPADNTFMLNQTVVGSYDPNDKTCLEGDIITPNLIGEYVHYMIRFENNGTANAQNIVVKDMIDLSKFDISTLIPTNASHSYITKISAGNKVEFIFENINLPFDDATNDGYIAFKIKTQPTLVVNDTFANEASIFFDYNFPILTNKATSTFKTLGKQDFEFTNYFTIYPNPVTAVLNITAKETIEVKSISIYNTLGQLVIVIPNAEKASKIDVSQLLAGNYFIKVSSNKGSSSIKFIKN